MNWSWGKQIVYFILVSLLEVECVPTPVPDLNDSCTNGSCFPPFPYCDENTHRCEALEKISIDWSNLYGKGWSADGLSAVKSIFVEVICSVDGDYPSADCRTFYRCKNGTATLQTCSSQGYPFYEPALGRCSNIKKCPTFDCFNRPSDKIGLSDELSPFFSYCILLHPMFGREASISVLRTTNTVQPLVISRCFGKDTFNPNSRRCDPMCLQEGLIPDTRDCHKYYLCTLTDSINVRFSKYSISCPQGEAFQEHLFRCVPENLVSTCKSPYPWPI